MKLRQLEAMRAVMANGTTTRAAEVLGVTQSAVSRLVSQLESELGLNLFDRRHGRLLITPEGQNFYVIAEKVLAGIDQIKATARDIQSLNAGALRIFAMPALGYGLLPDTIAKIKARYGRVKITVDIGTRPELEGGIAAARYDFGLATLPIEHESIDIEPLCGVNAVCILPPDHPLAARETVAAADLSGESFISIEPGALFRYRIDELFGGLGIRRSLRIEAQSTVMVCNMVAKGIGVSIVHPFIAETFGDSITVRRFEPALRFDYGMLFPAGQTRSKITREFVATLRDSVASMEDASTVAHRP